MFQNIKFNKRYLMALGLSLVLLFVNTLGLLLNTMVGPITPSNNDVWTNYVSRPVGTGRTESDPYRISTPSELAYLIENLGAGSWYIELISDINLSGHEWIPIKTTAENSVRFKGNGHTISNMKIKQPKKDGVGLFEGNFKNSSGERVYTTLHFSDTNFRNVDIYSYRCTGTVVAEQREESIIENVNVLSGTIFQHGEDFVGGIIGYTFGTVRNCINNATLKAFDNMCVGGIAGSNVGLVENCINTGDLYSFEFAGGIVGQSAGTIKNCYAECTITGSRYLGGVASYSENASYGSEIVNCGFNGEIVVEDTPVTKVGAIVGFGEKSNTSITDSFGVADIYFKDITDTSCVLPFGANIDNVVNNCYSYSHIYTSSDEFEYRKLIGNDFSNFAVHKNINGGSPFPKSLFAVGQFIESDAFSTLLDNDFDRIKTDLVITREGDARYIELGIYPQTYVGKSQNENNSLIFDNGAYLPSYAQEKKINRDTVTHSAYKRQNSWKDPTSGLQIVSGGSNNSYEFEDGTIIKNGASSYGEYWFKMEPIKWKILNWKDAMLGADLIVISDKVLSSSIAWCKTSTLDADWSSDTSDCSIRPWLNNHFYQDAFTDAERALIKTTRVQCNDVYSNTADKPTLTVQDKIWFMSKDEVGRYLPNLEHRAVKPTDYALFSGCVINSNRNCDWWTRTALATDVKTVVVTADGQVNNVGIGTKTIGVRPVMTIII